MGRSSIESNVTLGQILFHTLYEVKVNRVCFVRTNYIVKS